MAVFLQRGPHRALLSLPPDVAVIRRELLTNLRFRRTFLMVALMVGAAAMVFGIGWPSDDNLSRSGSSLFEGVVNLSFGFCLLFVPGLACLSITTERQRDTLDLLRMTELDTRYIVRGKLINVIALYFLMLLALLPMIASLFFLTGINIESVFYAGILLAGTVVTCGLIGIAFGAWIRQPLGALVGAYVVALAVVLPLEHLILLGYDETIHRVSTATAFWLPTEAMTPLGMALSMEAVSAREGIDFVLCLLYLLAIALGMRWKARASLLSSRPLKVADRRPVIDNVAILEARRKQFPYYLIDPLKRKPPLEDWHNPFLMRELRWGFLGRLPAMIRQFYLSLIGLGFLFAVVFVANISRVGNAVMLMLVVEVALVLFAAVVVSSSVLAKEVETGNLDFVRSALVPSAGVFSGKVLSLMVSLAPMLTGILLVNLAFGWLTAYYGDTVAAVALATGTLTILLNLLYTVAVCLFVGTWVHSTSAALLAGFVAVLLAQFGPFVCGFIVFLLWEWPGYGKALHSPTLGFFVLLESELNITVFHRRVELTPFLRTWVLQTGFYLVLSAVLYGGAWWAFQRRFLRAR